MCKTLNVSCHAVLVLAAALATSGSSTADVEARVDTIFRAGQYREVEVSAVRPGFLGGPEGLRGAPAIGPPTQKWHLVNKRLRVTVTDVYGIEGGTRVILRIDEVLDSGEIDEAPLWYGYLLVSEKGVAVGNETTLRSRECEPVPTGPVPFCYVDGVPFPLHLTAPPVLNSQPGGELAGALYRDHVAAYEREEGDSKGSGAIKIEAVLGRRTEPGIPFPAKQLRYFNTETMQLTNEKAPAQEKTLEVRLVFRETQSWDREDDWLWQKMERFDSRGYLTMRCQQVERR